MKPFPTGAGTIWKAQLLFTLPLLWLFSMHQPVSAQEWQTLQGEEEGRGGGVDVSYTWGKFKFDNGAREAFFALRSRYAETADVSIDVRYLDSGGKQMTARIGGRLRPGQVLKDIGNYVIARSILGYALRSQPRPEPSKSSPGQGAPGSDVNVITYPGTGSRSPNQTSPTAPSVDPASTPDSAERQRLQQERRREQQIEQRQREADRRQQEDQRRREQIVNRARATADSYRAAGDTLNRGLNNAGQQIVDQMNKKAERERLQAEEAERRDEEREKRRQEREEEP